MAIIKLRTETNLKTIKLKKDRAQYASWSRRASFYLASWGSPAVCILVNRHNPFAFISREEHVIPVETGSTSSCLEYIDRGSLLHPSTLASRVCWLTFAMSAAMLPCNPLKTPLYVYPTPEYNWYMKKQLLHMYDQIHRHDGSSVQPTGQLPAKY
jgi:hypothetical protein